MSEALQLEKPVKTAPSRRFPTVIGRFDKPADRATIDTLVQWIQKRYQLIHNYESNCYH